MKPNILFDLDGTLLDPRTGILGCIRHALERAGHTAPPEEELLWCIGPPLYSSFPQILPGITEAQVLELVAFYRERFGKTGMFENKIYPGIPELLSRLAENRKLFLATSKPHFFAKPILVHFGLADAFTSIHGSELDGKRSDKSELISYILAEEGIAAADALIVGDTKFDILGAKKAGILGVGITWGYGSRKDLEDAGADYIFDEPESLRQFLLS